MTPKFIPFLLCLALQACAIAPPANIVGALTRQAHAWDEAIVRKDMPAVAANMATDYRHIRDNGAISDSAGFLAFIASPKLVIDPYKVEDLDIRLYGDVALVTGRTRMTGRYDGNAFKSHYRYTDVYVQRDGQWRVTSVQITPMPD
ncbi:MAG: nuclear transport factor 2 family protein [Pseudomonadota bacterium]